MQEVIHYDLWQTDPRGPTLVEISYALPAGNQKSSIKIYITP